MAINLDQIQAALRAQQLDGWLFFDHHLRDPIAYRILGLNTSAHATRRWYYLIPARGEPRALVHRIEPALLDGLPGERIAYSTWQEQEAGLRKLLEGLKRVAMQYSPRCAIPYIATVDAGTVEWVREFGVEVVSSAELVQQFEACWSARALELHLEAARRVDRVRSEIFAWLREALHAGRHPTEYETQQRVLDLFKANGLVTDFGPIVAVNAHASDPHYAPSPDRPQPIRPGDLLLFDHWARLDEPEAVYYDVTWMAYCGEQPPEEMTRIFNIVLEARDAGIACVQEAVRTGRELRGFEVDDVVRGVIARHGLAEYFTHRTGHSIGREVHGNGANMDNFETHDERRLVPGAAFSIEPGIYLPQFGVRSEVNVYVGDKEAIVTGEVQRDWVLL